jgi:hypothetical protein
LFADLLESKVMKKAAIKRANDLVADDILASTAAANESLQMKKSKSSVEGYASANSSLSISSTDGGSSRRQVGVLTSFEKSATIDCNSADLDAAIAQMVYCRALPFSFGECPYFQRVIQVAQSAPTGCIPPKRMALCGDMLDIAYQSQLERDFRELLLTLMYLASGSLAMVPSSTSALSLTSLPLHFMCLP